MLPTTRSTEVENTMSNGRESENKIPTTAGGRAVAKGGVATP